VVSAHPDHGARVDWTVPTAAELRDQGMAQVERRAGKWEREVIDIALSEVIDIAMRTGSTFTANDVRPRLPEEVNRALIGARFQSAAKAGKLVRVGYERSTDPRTRSAVVAVWRPA
jgi:hypothetical protein